MDESRAELERLRSELLSTQAETLEICLATQELWTRLAGAASPPALAESIAQVRARLAEQYRQAGAELVRQRVELEAFRHELRLNTRASSDTRASRNTGRGSRRKLSVDAVRSHSRDAHRSTAISGRHTAHAVLLLRRHTAGRAYQLLTRILLVPETANRYPAKSTRAPGLS